MKPMALLLALLVAAGVVYAQAPSTFDDCDRYVLQHPDQEEGYRCYIGIAGRGDGWNEAARRLEALVAVDPGNHLAKLALASVEARRGGERAEALYVESIDAFQSRNETGHEVAARLEYATFLALRGRAAESGEQLQSAMNAAVQAGDTVLSATVSVHLARTEYYQARYEAAENRLLKVRKTLFRDGDGYQKAMWLGVAGSVRWGMARFPEAMQDYQEQAELLALLGNPYEEAVARSNVALLASTVNSPPYSEETRQRLIGLVDDALAAAIRGGNKAIEGKSELYLGQLVSGVQEARDHLERGLAISRGSGKVEDRLLGYRLLAESLVQDEPRDPVRGMKLLEAAVGMAEQTGSPQNLARTRMVQATLHWELLRSGNRSVGDRETAIRLSLAALDAIEAIRDSQSGGTVRARTFSPWTFFYSRFIGNLLWPPDVPPAPEEAARAFRIMERMRAQVFLEELDAADAGRDQSDMPWTGVPGIGQIQERLQDNEAVLSYLTADLWVKEVFSGGSWLTVISRGDVGIYSLPPKTELAAMIDLTLGSIRNRDYSERPGLARLYRDLLEEPLRSLPEEVNHLIIVPDGPLHRLPFGALQDPGEDQPLGTRYRISQVPSVASWLHWTGEKSDPAPRPAVAWIDPDIDNLGRLPYTVLEAKAAREYLGSSVRVQAAGQAMESRFKKSMLQDFGIIHLAAHGVVDDLHPDLSGIVLAAGDGEDGLLQVREIVGLNFTGRTVILSACRSASGTTLEGEGVLSLARAFFVAGAQAVVANLWPVRDDEAAAFSADLYRHLGEGMDLAGALASTRRDRVAGGDHTEAWAGTVLFGNGRVKPFDGEVRRGWWSWTWLAAVAGILAVFAGFRGFTLHRRWGHSAL